MSGLAAKTSRDAYQDLTTTPITRTEGITDQSPLTRDQLLAALDKEIADVASVQSATGRTRWATLLSLATLIAFGLQSWNGAKQALHEVLVAVLAFVTCWDFARDCLKSMDTSSGASQNGPARFFKVSELLGGARSTLFVHCLRQGVLLGLAIWLRSPYLYLTIAFYWVEFVIQVIGWLATFTSLTFGFEPGAGRRYIRFGTIFSFTFHGLAALSTLLLVRHEGSGVHEPQLRLALIICASSYLVVWLTEENIPNSFLARLRDIRQNLAFNRITLDEAISRSELFLTGYAPTQILRRPFEEISTVIGAAQVAGAVLNQTIVDLSGFTQKFSESSQGSPSYEIRSGLVESVSAVKAAKHGVEAHLVALGKKIRKFKSKLKVWAIFSPEAAKQLEPLLKQMEDADKSFRDKLTAADATIAAARKALENEAEQPLIQQLF